MKTIIGFPSYCITRQGYVWSTKRHRWLKPYDNRHGYLVVRLCENGKSFRRTIHRLVLETFVGKRPCGMECRHLDGNSKNNAISNLCWGTPSENAKDSIRHGTSICLNQNGEKNPNAKLTSQHVKIIIYLYKTGLFNQKEIGDLFHVSDATISRIVNTKNWKQRDMLYDLEKEELGQ